MANENDYRELELQDKLGDTMIQLEDSQRHNLTLECIIRNRESEIDGLKQQLENLEAENRFLREQLVDQKGIYLKG